MKKTIFIIPALVGVMLLASCNEDPVLPTKIEIEQGETQSVEIGKTLQLTAKVTPEDAEDKSHIWTIKSGDAVTLTAEGLITAIKEGTSVIEVAAKANATITDKITITVPALIAPVDEIEVEIENGETATMVVEETLQLTAKVTANNTENIFLRWEATGSAVRVDQDTGLVTALEKGEAIVKVTASRLEAPIEETEAWSFGDATDTITITVEELPIVPTIEITTGESVVMLEEATLQLNIVIGPDELEDKTYAFSVEGDAVSVTDKGLVTALVPGDAVVTVSANADTSIKDSIKIHVDALPPYAWPSGDIVEFFGDELTLPTFTPENTKAQASVSNKMNEEDLVMMTVKVTKTLQSEADDYVRLLREFYQFTADPYNDNGSIRQGVNCPKIPNAQLEINVMYASATGITTFYFMASEAEETGLIWPGDDIYDLIGVDVPAYSASDVTAVATISSGAFNWGASNNITVEVAPTTQSEVYRYENILLYEQGYQYDDASGICYLEGDFMFDLVDDEIDGEVACNFYVKCEYYSSSSRVLIDYGFIAPASGEEEPDVPETASYASWAAFVSGMSDDYGADITDFIEIDATSFGVTSSFGSNMYYYKSVDVVITGLASPLNTTDYIALMEAKGYTDDYGYGVYYNATKDLEYYITEDEGVVTLQLAWESR